MWKKIDDSKVLNVYIPTCDGGCEQQPIELEPSFYEDNGTPICMCGCDMRYSHTIVNVDTSSTKASNEQIDDVLNTLSYLNIEEPSDETAELICEAINVVKSFKKEKGEALDTDLNKAELEGAYECPHCGGHFMVDSTYLDQVESEVSCMYCKNTITFPEI